MHRIHFDNEYLLSSYTSSVSSFTFADQTLFNKFIFGRVRPLEIIYELYIEIYIPPNTNSAQFQV